MGKMLLVVVDQMSKWLEVEILPRTDSCSIITSLRKMFATFGVPRTVIADNATYFQSAEMMDFCNRNGVRLAASAPYHPRTNGLAERGVQTVKSALEKMKDDRTPLQELLSRFLFDNRNTPHSTTGRSPAELMMGRRLRSRLDLIKPETGDRVFRNQERAQRGVVAPQFQVGDRVYARQFQRTGANYAAGVITERRENYSYVMRLDTGALIHRHVDHLKRAAVGDLGRTSTRSEEAHAETAIQPEGSCNRPEVANSFRESDIHQKERWAEMTRKRVSISRQEGKPEDQTSTLRITEPAKWTHMPEEKRNSPQATSTPRRKQVDLDITPELPVTSGRQRADKEETFSNNQQKPVAPDEKEVGSKQGYHVQLRSKAVKKLEEEDQGRIDWIVNRRGAIGGSQEGAKEGVKADARARKAESGLDTARNGLGELHWFPSLEKRKNKKITCFWLFTEINLFTTS
jgi:hypothetical protein